MIAVLDYGSGNVRAFLNAYGRMNIACIAARIPDDLARATRIILPGVGAFDTAIRQFNESGLKAAVEQRVLNEGMPLLGICVGMQMLALGSEEGIRTGLGWIPGRVRRLPDVGESGRMRLPHMGWNHVEVSGDHGLLAGLPERGRFYFLHSYFFDAADDAVVTARCRYGDSFPCAVRLRNLHAVQFHPEKSHVDGMKVLRNFAQLVD